MNQYYCPYCSSFLNVKGYIVLSYKRDHGKSGVMFMSDELGDYTVHLNKEVKINKGEKTHFYCPCCSKSLEFEKDENMVKIFKVDENGEEHTVIFSAIFGEKLTYLISEERQQSFGEKAQKYLDPEWFLKR
jgi:hypothetical protein